MDVPLAIGSVLTSCCGCMVLVEYLAKNAHLQRLCQDKDKGYKGIKKPWIDAGSMNLMTFSTFLFISLEGLIFQTKFLTVKNKIPIRGYLTTVLLFFTVNVINNQALNYHVPVPLHIIFRSGSLLANMVLGMWLLQKRYSMQKYISIILITIGIIICTLATSGPQKSGVSEKTHVEDAAPGTFYREWVIGITMLWFALFFSALLGITQEKMYATYGKHPKEALFYCHVLALPGFIFMAKDIYKHSVMFSESEMWTLPILNVGAPSLWIILFACDVAQYYCIKSVYTLTAECSSLTVTLVVTLRKFISLLVSIIYFKNPFTFYHWIGTALVFGGTLIFSDIIGQTKQAFGQQKPRPKAE